VTTKIDISKEDARGLVMKGVVEGDVRGPYTTGTVGKLLQMRKGHSSSKRVGMTKVELSSDT
jgi:hypothetical protein